MNKTADVVSPFSASTFSGLLADSIPNASLATGTDWSCTSPELDAGFKFHTYRSALTITAGSKTKRRLVPPSGPNPLHN